MKLELKPGKTSSVGEAVKQLAGALEHVTLCGVIDVCDVQVTESPAVMVLAEGENEWESFMVTL